MMDQKIFMVIDTETVGLEGNVYDIAWTITNKRGDILGSFNALVEENFTNPKKMMGAFYAGKLFTHYAGMLERGEVKLTPWRKIIKALRSDIEEHGVTVICAYNAGFDFRVMRNTHRALGGKGSVLTAPLKTLDLWRFACETKLSQKQYKRLARAQGWVSAAGNIRSGAEYAFRFCSGDFGFIEDHTALSDARIEAQILAECFKQKKAVPYGKINGAPWRIIQDKAA